MLPRSESLSSAPQAEDGTREDVQEILATFFTAQKKDFSAPRPLGEKLSSLVVDDDRSLVNSFFIVEDPALLGQPGALRDIAARAGMDALRTEVIVPSAAEFRVVRDFQRDMRGVVRRVARLNEFLDGFLRPGKICRGLMEDGEDKPNSPEGLLYEKDFIQPQARGREIGSVLALNHLVGRWAHGESPRLCMLLAPAGYGKSKLTHMLAKRLAQAYEQNRDTEQQSPLPFFIPFGQYRRSTSFTGLILSVLDQHGNSLLTVDAFRFLVGRGRVLFILDGYDELIESQPETARANIAEFIANSGPGSRILLTSRSVFYRTSDDVVSEVGDPLLTETEVEVLELQPFSRVQAKEFLNKTLSNPHDRSRKLERAQEIIDRDRNMEILGSPFFLAEFAQMVQQNQWKMADVERRGSLEFMIFSAFDRERLRQGHGLTDEEQRAFIEIMAFDMLVTGASGYSKEDLQLFGLEAVRDPEALGEVNFWSHHFLHSEENRAAGITMSHQVWRDYFQGTSLAAHLGQGNPRAKEIIQTRDLPEGVLRAAAQALGSPVEKIMAALSAKLTQRGMRNALRMALLDNELADEPRQLPAALHSMLEACDLSELNFTRVDLRGVNLRRAKLAGCHFQNCDLRTANLEDAVLSRTTFSGCEVDAGILRAELSSVTVGDKQYFGPQIREYFAPGGSSAGVPEAPSAPDEAFRMYSERIMRERLRRFVRSGHLVEWISWVAFIGGVSPRDREFVVRRIYRALRVSGIVQESKAVAGSRPPICLAEGASLRNEVLAFANGERPGPILSAALDNLR